MRVQAHASSARWVCTRSACSSRVSSVAITVSSEACRMRSPLHSETCSSLTCVSSNACCRLACSSSSLTCASSKACRRSACSSSARAKTSFSLEMSTAPSATSARCLYTPVAICALRTRSVEVRMGGRSPLRDHPSKYSARGTSLVWRRSWGSETSTRTRTSSAPAYAIRASSLALPSARRSAHSWACNWQSSSRTCKSPSRAHCASSSISHARQRQSFAWAA
mmetsp:Transcript_16756/g.36287  ORF Transcript_16756/g.36287 Transcript_16756/m.36287 type:complete len:223 (-) Transcript_16756:465-1133(-)